MRTIHLLAAALLMLGITSCSKDDGFAPGTDDNPGGDLQEFTFTVGMDYTLEGEDGTAAPMANSPGTRATATEDDTPTRCFMQVFKEDGVPYIDEPLLQESEDNYTFTVHLDPRQTYTFCFWADNGAQDINSLTAVPYAIGTVAFAAKVSGAPQEVQKDVTLKHVVTKVSLATTAATTIADGKEATLATQCATEYNALSGAVTASGTQTCTASASGSYDANADIVSCYVIPTTEKQDITIGCHLLEQTIAKVPLTVNTHVTLKGDLSEESEKWEATPKYIQSQFDSLFFKDGEQIGYDTGNGEYWLSGTREALNILLRTISRNPDFSVSDDGDLSFVIGTTVWIPPVLYALYQAQFSRVHIVYSVSDSKSYDWYILEDPGWPSLPTVGS